MRRALGVGAAGVAVAVLVLLSAAPASAHAYIVSSSPAQGATVHGLTRVSITFDEDLLDLGRNAIEVRGPGGRRVETACATVTGATLAVPVAPARSGVYRVAWRASSADGHLVGGDYAFRYDGPAAADPSPAPSCAPVGTAATPRTPPGSTALLVAVAVSVAALLAVLAVVVVAVVVVRRADRGAGQAGGGESPP